MSNYVFIQAGQCGNQLGYSLIDSLYDHLHRNSNNLETFFRYNNNKLVSRSICLDTEPKVINESIAKANYNKKWCIDTNNVLYRHGGAGNNWALGYEMATNEFIELTSNIIRKELEHCDYNKALVFLHSVAGGTGSGLGTHITEVCQDLFPETTRLNIAISPYHFGEVVVQHYNLVLCLSKISSASHGVLIFENETAQMLCRTMHGIERPTLDQLNSTIVSNLCPIFLPKTAHSYRGNIIKKTPNVALIDDLMYLCNNPAYKLLDVKLTPQTSKRSVEYTYDNWSTLLKTIQQLQLSGAASERNILATLKRNWHHNVVESETDAAIVKSVASSITLHGLEAPEAASQVLIDNSSGPSDIRSKNTQQLLLHDYYCRSHVRNWTSKSSGGTPIWSLMDSSTVTVRSSPISLNGYERSASVLTNGQSVLPLLQRAMKGGSELFTSKAYLHQYSTYNIEEEDFLYAFRTIGCAIHSYQSL